MRIIFRNLCLYTVKKDLRFFIIPGQGKFGKWHLGRKNGKSLTFFYSVLSHALEEDGMAIQIKKTFYIL